MGETLKIAFPNYNDIQIDEIMQWFMNESSIRDPKSANFTVNPLIRRQMLTYNSKIIGPKTHQEKLARYNA